MTDFPSPDGPTARSTWFRLARVAAAYVAASLALWGAADIAVDAFDLSDRLLRYVVIVTVLGLPLVLAGTWVYVVHDASGGRFAVLRRALVPAALLAVFSTIGFGSYWVGGRAAAPPPPLPEPRQITYSGSAGGLPFGMPMWFSPDGQFVSYFDGMVRGEDMALMLQDLAGKGEPRELMRHPDFLSNVIAWNPEGTHLLLFTTGNESGRKGEEAVKALPRLGGVLEPVLTLKPATSGPARRRATLGTNGECLYLWRHEPTGIDCVPLDGDGSAAYGMDVVAPTGIDYPAIGATPSPGGRSAYVRQTSGDLVLLTADRDPQVLLTGVSGVKWHTSSVIVATRRSPAGTAFIRVELDPETHRLRRTDRLWSIGEHVGAFDLSADERQLVFRRVRTDTSIWALAGQRESGTRLSRVTSYGRTPRVSPTGGSIAFLRGSQLYLVPAVGERPRLLATFEDSITHGMEWSPDGSRLLLGFVTTRRAELAVVEPTSGGVHRFTVPARPRILVARWLGGDAVLLLRNDRMLQRLDPETGDATDLVPLTGANKSRITDFVVSPDGKRIAYNPTLQLDSLVIVSVRHGSAEVVRLDPAPGAPRTGRLIRWGDRDRLYLQSRSVFSRSSVATINIADGTIGPFHHALPEDCWNLSIGPEGERAACERRSQLSDLWLVDLDPTLRRPVTN